MARYAVVDVANLFHRVRHGVRGDAFTKAGMTLHVVFRSLRKLWREHKCTHVVLCLEGKSWRHEVYPAYKSKRRLDQAASKEIDREEEEIFFHTMDNFSNYMAEKTRCTVLQSPGIEGDDFIARWIQLHPNDEHVILSGDSDFVQLIAPNVSIYNGIEDRLMNINGVFDGDGKALVFSVSTSTGKIKVGKTLAEAAKDHAKAEKEVMKLRPSHVPTEFSFEPETEWWKKALFLKIIRGDTSDSIFSAYPGVRYKGSKAKNAKVSISEAWEDRNDMGYQWNNFMLQKWEKLISVDDDGNRSVESVRVLDEYKLNESLIDLTLQPQRIKDLMDEVIIQAVQKEPVGNVGVHFMRFCSAHDLKNLGRETTDHAAYLNAGYR